VYGDCYGTRKWWNFTLISRLSRGETGTNVLVTIDGFLRCGADLTVLVLVSLCSRSSSK
jgi:hypothetical protein